MRAIALHGLLQTALDFERYLAAVTATFVVHSRAPKSPGFLMLNARIERVPEPKVLREPNGTPVWAPLVHGRRHVSLAGLPLGLPVLARRSFHLANQAIDSN